MRTIDSAIMARLEAKELRLFILIDMNVDGTHYRYTDCDVPLVAGGYTYAPRGMKLEPVRYSMSTVVDSVKLRIDNLDDAFTSMFIDGTPQGSEVTVQVALVEKWGEVDDETGATWGPAVHGLSFADGQAFVKTAGVDLSPYAGVEGTSTPYMITIHDSAGKTARGYIGAADEGETLSGSELLNNTGFETLTSGTDDDGTSDNFANWLENSSDVDGEKVEATTTAHGGSRAVKLTKGTGTTASIKLTKTPTAGKLYKATFWTRGSGGVAGRFRVYDSVATLVAVSSTGVTGDVYTQVSRYFTVSSGATYVGIQFYPGESNGNVAYFDDVSIQEVTHVGVTGVHLVSEANGSTRNWTSIGSGFNYNDSAYIFEIRDAESRTNWVYFNLNDPFTIFQGTIDGWNLDEEEVAFTVASELVRWNQRTLAKHSASCRWKEFKGTECAYAGAESWCDRSYTRCVALGNKANFGGFRWLPSIVNKQVWWGRVMNPPPPEPEVPHL